MRMRTSPLVYNWNQFLQRVAQSWIATGVSVLQKCEAAQSRPKIIFGDQGRGIDFGGLLVRTEPIPVFKRQEPAPQHLSLSCSASGLAESSDQMTPNNQSKTIRLNGAPRSQSNIGPICFSFSYAVRHEIDCACSIGALDFICPRQPLCQGHSVKGL
jgi:hypothetical protein